MKAKTRMFVASAVVIAFALTAVSGITYSWFSDNEQTEIGVSTARVDYVLNYSDSVTVNEDGTIEVANLKSDATVNIVESITNNSSISTIYKITATPTIEEGSNFTYYDLINVSINGIALTVENLGKEIVIKDWSFVKYGDVPDVQTITITTPADYGGATPENPIKSYSTLDGTGSTDEYVEGTENTAPWSNNITRSGLLIKLSVIATQGDYPYTSMTVTDKVASATLPANRVVKAAEIASSGDDSKTAQNVIVDFSNVSTYDTGGDSVTKGNDIAGKAVTVKVASIDTDNSTIKLDFNLKETADADKAIEAPTFDQPAIITMTVPGKYVKPLVLYDGDKANGKVISNTYDSVNNTSTIVFSVSHFSSYTVVDAYEVVTVSTEAELIEKMEDGYSVKLGEDITMSENKGVTLPESGAVSLDLNGYKITFNLTKDKFGFNYYDVFTVYDSSDGKAGSITTDAGIIFHPCSGDASLTINSGNYTVGSGTVIGTPMSEFFSQLYGSGPILVSDILINGGTFTSTKAGDGSSAALIEVSAELTVNGGTFGETGSTSSLGTQLFHLLCGKAVFNNGTFAVGQAFIFESFYSTVTVNGGSYKGTSSSGHNVVMFHATSKGYGVTVNGGYFEVTDNNETSSGSTMLFGYATVNGGTFVVNGSNCCLVDYNSTEQVTINGGEFYLSDGSKFVDNDETKFDITGGTFNADPSLHVKSGYAATKDETAGVWTVSESVAT